MGVPGAPRVTPAWGRQRGQARMNGKVPWGRVPAREAAAERGIGAGGRNDTPGVRR